MKKGPEYIGRLIGALITLVLYFTITGCSSFRLATLNHDPMYPVDYVIPISEDTKIDTLSFSQLRWKLRTDFNFRWDYAQYAMNQPYSWYSSSFGYSPWKPYNSFDVYFNRHNFWNDWAFNYPYYWGYSSWYNPWRHSWYRPYRGWDYWYNWGSGPWYNSGYNVVWNSTRENTNNITYVRGPRSSRNNSIISINDNNIENTVSRRYNNPRSNIDNSNLNNIVNELRENYNIKPRVYNNPNNYNNDQINGLNIRSNRSTEGNNNGWRSRSGQIVPPNSIRPVFPSSSQSGQIRGGSGASSVQQSGGRSSSGGQGGRGSSGVRN